MTIVGLASERGVTFVENNLILIVVLALTYLDNPQSEGRESGSAGEVLLKPC